MSSKDAPLIRPSSPAHYYVDTVYTCSWNIPFYVMPTVSSTVICIPTDAVACPLVVRRNLCCFHGSVSTARLQNWPHLSSTWWYCVNNLWLTDSPLFEVIDICSSMYIHTNDLQHMIIIYIHMTSSTVWCPRVYWFDDEWTAGWGRLCSMKMAVVSPVPVWTYLKQTG